MFKDDFRPLLRILRIFAVRLNMRCNTKVSGFEYLLWVRKLTCQMVWWWVRRLNIGGRMVRNDGKPLAMRIDSDLEVSGMIIFGVGGNDGCRQ
jgi:hypothetical protein